MAGEMELSGLKVVVIDDSNTIRRSAEIFLGQVGCTVVPADDGFDALGKIVEHEPDLVLCDVLMPRLDGYQTCSLIRRNARFRTLPVLMLSSKDGLFDRVRGRMVGADEYLTKPFTKDSLIRAVAQYARRGAPAAPGAAGAAGAGAAPGGAARAGLPPVPAPGAASSVASPVAARAFA